MKTYRYLPLVLAAWVAACGPDPQQNGLAPVDTIHATPPDGAVPPPPDTAAIPLSGLVERVHERGPDGKLRILEDLGPPVRTEREAVQNRHDPAQTDTIRTIFYPGLQIEIYDVSAAGRGMVQSIQVTGSGYQTGQGLRIGSTLGEVRNALGEPDRIQDGAWVYEGQGGDDNPTPPGLHLSMEGEQVAKMTWHFYVD